MLFFCLCLLFMQTETFHRPIFKPVCLPPPPLCGSREFKVYTSWIFSSVKHPEAWCCQSGGGCGLFALSWPWVVSVSTRGQSHLSCLMLDSYNSWIPLVFVIVRFDALFDMGVIPFWWYPWCGFWRKCFWTSWVLGLLSCFIFGDRTWIRSFLKYSPQQVMCRLIPLEPGDGAVRGGAEGYSFQEQPLELWGHYLT